ncbi:MAG TPA: glycoside hydrolase family 9 protein [Ignavibacteriaceae bacterium]|jgi:peptidoglycan/xylan/chitin deacetylase (PgdA/CDA1 family)|nr:glycoside hydrolase family 9 protein [Ignavibacteriaceae bacterium]HPO56850.1 glycoside hydrolase family 9 protein [Ignavibacteriaceae bacterium]
MQANYKIRLSVFFLFSLFLFAPCLLAEESSWIRINQLGYLPNSVKAAVLVSKENPEVEHFVLKDAATGDIAWYSTDIKRFGKWGPFQSGFRLDFTAFNLPGTYFVECGSFRSPGFVIGNHVYDGTADFLLNYMRQQRCGYNPFIDDSCHTHDGFIIYHPDPQKDSTYIDARGGWHDASDYLQYVTTSANAVFQMLFAYQQNPGSFRDLYDANGRKGPNGIPDILDEAKWGLDWLVRMNPEKDVMYNQLADDRDHAGFRLPNLDTTSYNGFDLRRPVYYCTGKPQGISKYKNNSTGIASTAGKYASAFALGSQLLAKFYPDFARQIWQKAIEAYDFGLRNPGVCQTAPGKAPYYYEEDNWADDMELAAFQMFAITGNSAHFAEAYEYGRSEPVTLWMGADTASHYQYYPFVNLGHYYLAYENPSGGRLFRELMEEGLEKIYLRGKDNPFLIGIPFIWCSNNLVAAALTQARLYHDLTKEKTYLEMEAALRDWLFGCNPWGTSMIIGLPQNGVFPKDPHSALTHFMGWELSGGLVDGPVYGSIFSRLIGITIYNGDEFAPFQSDLVVYHDDYGDYSTNEPTMDGTASLSYYLSSLEALGKKSGIIQKDVYDRGGIIRRDTSKREIYLAFTGGDFFDGGVMISNTLRNLNVKANFFFTGDLYRNRLFGTVIRSLVKDGHYLGAHSDKHLLYADWSDRNKTLVTKEEFMSDLEANYSEMERFGIAKGDAEFFMPPYEWYNEEIAEWTAEAGLKLVNFTPGTLSNADYTTPDMGEKYVSSDSIYNRILGYEQKDPNGLNGFILLLHIGTDPARTDKFYYKLHELINELSARGYSFRRFGD